MPRRFWPELREFVTFLQTRSSNAGGRHEDSYAPAGVAAIDSAFPFYLIARKFLVLGFRTAHGRSILLAQGISWGRHP
jgi:hypothetical protein